MNDVAKTLRMDFSAVTLLCIGDVMLDRFAQGDIERISPEAPVPIIRVRTVREMLGGVGNVAHNIAALGGQAILIGLVGRDEAGATLRRLIADIPGITAALVETSARPTICKTRFVAGRQQVVRADDESTRALQPDEETDLLAAFDARFDRAQAVILSDYGKAALSPRLIAHVIATSRTYGIPVFVDPKFGDFARYRGATCITPNQKELSLAAGGLPVADEAEVVAAARVAMAAAQSAAILATRSEHGMILVEAGGAVTNVPARAREVFDVSGAGDTVIAALALAHAAGRPLALAMHIANAAAGVVVSKLGTATADIAEVLHELDEQDLAAGGHVLPGLTPLPVAARLVARWKEQGLTVGFTNGCFDIVHAGHVSLLAASRAQCDRLVVGLNDDASVARLKGPGRPINALESRATVISAIRHVDCVVGFAQDTPLDLIRALLPDVLVKGEDYTIEQVVRADVVLAAGGRVVLAKLVPGQSTTAIAARAAAAAGA